MVFEQQPTFSLSLTRTQLSLIESPLQVGCGQKDTAPTPLSSQSRVTCHWEGQTVVIHHLLQLRVEEVKFLVSVAENLGPTFLH